jgi:alkylation response protein AidB-like acyl-CoA dehydrogenase
MWTTNGGFADVLTVFAKIDDDDKLSAFIVEKGYEGITMNPEEHKMGIKGSSTRQIFFNDCKVPVENLLYERSKGFKMALNILNIGRIKLGSATIGGSKHAVTLSVQYANERKQFGQTIGSFGAIKHKLGDVTASIFASESALYRTAQNIEEKFELLREEGEDYSQAKLKSAEEFAIECAIMKVHGSEVLDYAVDEAVQIYGGMGFSAEAPVERAYRDARINRIFEGTNEINRLLTISMLMRRAMRGQIDLISPAMAVAKELTSIPDFGEEEEGLFSKEKKVLRNLKKAGLMISGAAIQKLQDKLRDEQEIIMSLSDMLIEGYTAESALLRAEKIIKMKGEEAGAIYRDLAMVYLHKAVEKSVWAGKQAIYAFAEGDEMRMMLMGLKRFTKIDPYNLKEARRRIANYLLEKNKYAF